jgi:signal transduction histidine kinase
MFLVAPFTRPETYRVLLFGLTGVFLGVVSLVILAVGWSLALGLAITPLVVPVLIGIGAAVRALSWAERGLARELLGVEAGRPEPARPEGFWARGFAVLRSKEPWREQAYLLLRLLVALPLFALAWWAGEALVAPLTYRWGWPDYDFWRPETQAESLLVFAAGVLGLVVVAHLARPFGVLSRALARRLLGVGPTRTTAAIRARRRRALQVHALVTALVISVLVLIWALTTAGYFWPAWPALALGLPLAIHASVYLVLTRPELQRLAGGSRALAIQVGVSASLFLFLVGIWAMSGGGYFWPVWPLLGLALVAGVHAALVVHGASHEERIEELETTRAGAVDVHEDELRRIERDLHDGAQASLVSLGINLGMAEQKLATDPAAAAELLAQARRGAREALEELRDLARGIHPPVLGDRGLEAAVAGLASRSPVHVTLSAQLSERPPAAVETAAYFVVAEAIANAGKHADASQVEISIRRTGGTLVVDVVDDGRGGADPNGHGLTGLRQRVAALDGTLEVTSPPGGPTRVRARIPCGS